MADKVDIYKAVGTSGLNRQGGKVEEEYERALMGSNRHKVLAEMQNDAVISAVLYAMEMLIRQVPWNTIPANDSATAVAAADFLRECLGDMSTGWMDTLSEILTFLPWGWAYMEVTYKMRKGPEQKDGRYRSKHRDGKIGWRSWGIRAQETLEEWEFDDNGGIKGMHQSAPPDYVSRFIPIEKALLFRTTTRKGNPEGRSIIRGAYRSWYFAKNIENIEGIGIERDLAGLPVGYLPASMLSGNASGDEKTAVEAYKKLLINIRRDEQEGILWPLHYDANGNVTSKLELLSTGGSRQFDTDKIVRRYDQRKAMTVLADFILVGHDNVGSFALSSSKTNLFGVALGSFLDMIAGVSQDGRPVGVVNEYAIPRLMQLNNVSTDGYPILTHGDIEQVDLKELGEYLSKLAGAGAPLFPNVELEKWLKAQGGLPVVEE